MAKEVEIKLKLTEIGGEQVKRLVAEITNVDEVTKALTGSVREAKSGFENMASAGFQMVQIRDLINGVTEAFNSLAKPALDFDHAMRMANTIARQSEEDFDKLKDSVADLAKEIPIARDLLAKGLYQTISNGVPDDNWISFLERSSKAAVGGIADLEKVVTVTSTVIKNYGLAWEEAGSIQDKIQLTADRGVTSFEQMAEALPKVTGSAAILGISVNELMATFATLTGVSGNTAEVSTQLSAVLTSLIAPTSEAAKMANEMGIQFDAVAIKAAGGLVSFLQNLTAEVDKFAKKTGMSAVEIESSLFGSARSLRALIPITGELAGKFEENVATMANSAGTIDFVFEQMNGTAQAAEQRLKNTIVGFTDFMASAAKTVMPMMSFIATAGIATTQLMALSKAIKGISWKGFITGIKTSTASVRAFGLALKAIPFVAIGAAAYELVSAFVSFTPGAEAARQAQEKMNRAMSEFEKYGRSEISQLRAIFDKLKSAKEGTEAWSIARKELQDKYGDYLKDLGIEIKTVDDLAKAYAELSKKIKQSAIDRATAEYKDIFAKVDAAFTGLYGGPVGIGGDDAEKQMELYKRNLEDFKEKQKHEIQNLYDLLAGNKKPEDFGGQGWNSERFKELMQQLQNIGVIQGNIARGWDLSGLRDYINGMRVVEKLREELAETDPPTIETDNGYNDTINTNVVTLDSLKKKRDELIKQSNEVSVSNTELAAKYRNEAAAIAVLIAEYERLIAVRQREMQGIDDTPADPLKSLPVGQVKLPDAKLAKPLSMEARIDIKIVRFSELQAKLQGHLDRLGSGVKLSGGEIEYLVQGIKDTKNEIAGLSDSATTLDDVLANVNEIGAAFGQLGSAIGSSAGAMLQWAGQSLSAMAQVITSIQALTAAREVEAAANATSAVTGAAASAASTPVVGWILAAAAVASMIALLSNMPKFAAGGLAYGPTLGLFGEYPGAANNPEVVAPLSKLKDLIKSPAGFGEVKFRIEGRTLTGVLNKINRFNSRTK